MKTRFIAALLLALSLCTIARPADAPQPAAVFATTLKKSAIAFDKGAFTLPKGTRLEVLGKDGDYLLVQFRSARGKILLADTDFDPATPVKETARTPVTAATAKPSTAEVKQPAPAPTIAPALSTNPADPQPTTNYGKMVQKAKTVEEAHKDKVVDPANEVLEEKKK